MNSMCSTERVGGESVIMEKGSIGRFFYIWINHSLLVTRFYRVSQLC